MNKTYIIKCSILLILFSTCVCTSDIDDLLAVIVVFRHGDRAPLQIYPNDPYNSTQWPMGLGQLTNQGKNRHYELGKWFRQRYDGFLSQLYSPSEIKVYSTDVDRTFMSAASNLGGLYPPDADQTWNSNLPWQPIPIHTASLSLLNGNTICTKYETLFSELFSTNSVYMAAEEENESLFEYLEQQSGLEIDSLSDACSFRDTLFVENHNGFVLPDWTSDVYPEKVQPLADLYFAAFSYTEELARLSSGPFLNNVIEHFNNVSNGVEDSLTKFVMYSAHDSSVASILGAMGAFEPHCPYYASTVIFELRQKSDGPYVYTYYKSQDDLTPVKLKGCTTVCSLSDFKSNLTNIAITPEEWVQECFNSTEVVMERSLRRTNFNIS